MWSVFHRAPRSPWSQNTRGLDSSDGDANQSREAFGMLSYGRRKLLWTMCSPCPKGSWPNTWWKGEYKSRWLCYVCSFITGCPYFQPPRFIRQGSFNPPLCTIQVRRNMCTTNVILLFHYSTDQRVPIIERTVGHFAWVYQFMRFGLHFLEPEHLHGKKTDPRKRQFWFAVHFDGKCPARRFIKTP